MILDRNQPAEDGSPPGPNDFFKLPRSCRYGPWRYKAMEVMTHFVRCFAYETRWKNTQEILFAWFCMKVGDRALIFSKLTLVTLVLEIHPPSQEKSSIHQSPMLIPCFPIEPWHFPIAILDATPSSSLPGRTWTCPPWMVMTRSSSAPWGFQLVMGVPLYRWMIYRENSGHKMDDLDAPPDFRNLHVCVFGHDPPKWSCLQKVTFSCGRCDSHPNYVRTETATLHANIGHLRWRLFLQPWSLISRGPK